MLPSLRRHGDLLVAYLAPHRPRVLLLALLLLLSTGLELAYPQAVRVFIDTAQKGGPDSALTVVAVAFLILNLGQQLVAMGATYVGAVVGWAATNRLRADLMQHCLRLDLPFHKTHTPGALIERIDGDVTLLANFFSQFTIIVLGNALLVAGIIITLSFSNIWIGLGLGLYCLATVVTLRAVQRRAVLRHAADRQTSAEQYGAIEERLVATEDIRGVGAEGYVLWRLLAIMQRRLRTNRAARLAGNITYFATNFLYVMAYALGLAIGAFLYLHHQVSLGTTYLITFYIGMLSGHVDAIRRQVQDMQQASAGLGRIDTLLQTETALPDTGIVILPPGPLSVRCDHLTFGYEDDEAVLRDISFSLPTGETLGVLGRTGSGKTTLTRLLARLYDPTDGAIELDGVDLRRITAHSLRSRVGVVTQDIHFFRASVRDNLTLFAPGIPDGRIIAALRALELRSWYDALPLGLDSPLAAGGTGLSAGEAQLLAFARVFLRDPGLVILDEATSRLDPATEEATEHAVDRLLAHRTGVVVAHRLHTVSRVDRILILEAGRIVEWGRRVDLLADPSSRFNALLQVGLEEVLV